MKLLFVISGVWFFHWLCLTPFLLLDIINGGNLPERSLIGLSTVENLTGSVSLLM